MKTGKLTVSCMTLGTILMATKVMLSYGKILPYSNGFDTILVGIALVCFVTRILTQKYSGKILAIYFAISVLALYSCIQAKNNSILITIVTLFALRNYDINKFLKTIFKVESIWCGFHVVYSLLYSIFVSWDKYLLYLDGRYRFSFGFAHANTFSALLFCNLMLYIWLNYESNLSKALLKTTIIECIAFVFTNSRTSMATYIILAFLILIRNNSIGRKLTKLLCEFGIPVFSICFISLIKGYIKGNPLSYLVDAVLTSRVKLGAYAYKDYGITFIGQYVKYLNNISWDQKWQLNSFTFDNVYSFLAISLGVVWIVVLSLAYYKCAKQLDVKSLIFMGIWIIYGLSETTILNGYFCFPVFLLVKILGNTVDVRQYSDNKHLMNLNY